MSVVAVCDASDGVREARVMLGRRGMRKTVGIPGTGLFYTEVSGKTKKTRKGRSQRYPQPPPPAPQHQLVLADGDGRVEFPHLLARKNPNVDRE